MAQAAPAYRYPERIPERSPRIRVVPGKGRQPEQQPLSPQVMRFARMFVAFLVVFAVIGFVRVGLASATVTTAIESDTVSTQIESARAEGNELDVRQSYLSNPSQVKMIASTQLGMGEPAETLTVTLGKDVVATNAQGDLSLSLSFAALNQG